MSRDSITATQARTLRESLVAELREARKGHDHAKAVFAAPYSGRAADATYQQSIGYWHGIAKAVELLDAHSGSSPLDGES